MHNVKSVEDMRMFQGRPLLTRTELDAIEESRRKFDLDAQKKWERRYYNRGHILSVVKRMAYVCECLKRGMLPYGIPKKVMATVFALRLV